MIFYPSRMGRLNKRALIRQLQKLGVASRADLAKALGMSQPMSGKIVDELIAAGVVITGSLTELPPVVIEHLSRAIESGAMWARFGKVECRAAPRRRLAGLVAVGIDQFIAPDFRPGDFSSQTTAPRFRRINSNTQTTHKLA